MTIRFNLNDGEEALIEDDALLVFIDETGIEDFSDPHFPIFGLGGCVVLANTYESEIRPAWQKMRQEVFGLESLHANELRKRTDEQIQALVQQLSSQQFTRVVAIASSKTAFPNGYEPYYPIASCLISRIESAAVQYKFSRIVVLVESATRLNDLAVRYLQPFNQCTIEGQNGKRVESITYHFIPKNLNEPGLEIADFIMHTVGAQTRNLLKNPEQETRKDYEAIIKNVPKKSVEYMSIDKVEVNVT